MTRLEPEKLKQLVRKVVSTRPDESDCEDCYDQLDQFVEMELAGKKVEQAMPLIRNHLDRCEGCCEEYEALLHALQGLDEEAA